MEKNTFNLKYCADNRSKPYVVTIRNNSGEANVIGSFVLFGANQYLYVSNYGSDSNIVYRVSPSSYIEVLNESQQKPFVADSFKVFSTDPLNFSQSLMFGYNDANGRALAEPLNILEYQDVYQVSTNGILIRYKTLINGEFNIKGTVNPNTSMQFLIYPKQQINTSNLLDETLDIIDNLSEPALSIFSKSLQQK